MLPDSLIDIQQEQSVLRRSRAEQQISDQLTEEDATYANNLARLYPTLPGGIVAPLALFGNQTNLPLANPLFLEASRLQQEAEANDFWSRIAYRPVRWAGAIAEELVTTPDRLIRTATRATQYDEDPLTAWRRAGSGVASQAVRNVAQGRPENLGTGLFPNSRDPFQTPGFQQDLQAGYDLTQASTRAIERTGVPSFQRSMEIRDNTTLQSVAGRAVPNPTLGRTFASTFLDPGTRTFGAVSGALDIAKYIWLDPVNIAAARFANARLARRTFAASELVGDNGMIVTANRRWIHSPTAEEWAASRDGQKMWSMLADNTSWTRAKAAFPGLENATISATVALDDPAEIAAHVTPYLGNVATRIPTPVTTLLGRPTLTRNVAGGLNRLGDVVGFNLDALELGALTGIGPATKWATETTRAGRWLGQLHKDYMNAENINEAVDEAYRFMVQAKFNRTEMDDYLFRLSNTRDGEYVRLYEIGKDMADTWGNKLRARGWPEPAIERVKTMWDQSFENNQYFVNNAGNHVFMDGQETITLFNGRIVPVPQVHMYAEYLQRSVPLANPLIVMRGNSGTRTLMNYVRDAASHVPVVKMRVKGPLYDDQGFLADLGDLYYKRVFKPLVLLRPAWMVRVVGEELLRMTASGLDSPFNHPLRYLAWTMSPDSIGELAKGRRDIFNRILIETPQGKNAMSRIQARMLSTTGSSPTSVPTQAWDVIPTKSIKSFQQRTAVHEGYARELLQLTNEPITARLVSEGVDATVDWMLHTPDGHLLRRDMASGVKTTSKHRHTWQNIDTEPDVVRRYVESVNARLHQKTGGNWVGRDPNGGWVDDFGEAVTDPKIIGQIPEGANFHITNPGNRQLQEILGTREFLDPRTGKRLLKIEDNMSMRQYRAYRDALIEHFWDSRPGFVKAPITLEMSAFGKRMDDFVSDMFRLFGERPTNYLSRSPAFTQLYWDNIGYFALGADRPTRLALLEAARRANVERELLRSVRKWGLRAGIDEKTLRKAGLVDLPRPKLGNRPSVDASHDIVDAYELARRPPPDLPPAGPDALPGPPSSPLPLAPGGTGGAALAIPEKPNNFVSLNPFEQAEVIDGLEELNRLVRIASTGDAADMTEYLMAHPEIVDRLADPVTMGHILEELGTDFGGKFLDEIPIRWTRKPSGQPTRAARKGQTWASVEVLPEQVAADVVNWVESAITQQGVVPQTIDLIVTRSTLEEAATSLRRMVGESAGTAGTQADGSWLATRATNKGIEVRYKRPPDKLLDEQTLLLSATDRKPPGLGSKGSVLVEDQLGMMRGAIWYDADNKRWTAETIGKNPEQFWGKTRDEALYNMRAGKFDEWAKWDIETVETVVPWKYLATELGYLDGPVTAARDAASHLASDIVLRLDDTQLQAGLSRIELKTMLTDMAREGHIGLEEAADLNPEVWLRAHGTMNDYYDSPAFTSLETKLGHIREQRIRGQLGGQGQWDFTGKVRLPEPWRDPRQNPHFAQTAPVKTDVLLKYLDPEIAAGLRRMGDVSGQMAYYRTRGMADPVVLEYHIQTRELRVAGDQEKLVLLDRLNAESVPVRVYVRQNPFDELDYTVKVNTKAAKEAQVRCAAGEHPCARNFPGGNDDEFSPAHLLSKQSVVADNYLPPPDVYLTPEQWKTLHTDVTGTVREGLITVDDLPDEVYHVTAFVKEIADDGTIRARFNGGMDANAPLKVIPTTASGRLNRMRVSLTDNPEIAVQLTKDFRTMARWAQSPEAQAYDDALRAVRELGPNPRQGAAAIEVADERHEAMALVDQAAEQMQPFLDMVAEKALEEFEWPNAERFIAEFLDPEEALSVRRSPKTLTNEYYNRRSSWEEIPNPIFLGDDLLENYGKWNPDNVGIIAIPKENLNTGAAIWRFDQQIDFRLGDVSKMDALSEVTINGNVNIAGGRVINVPYDHADTVDMYMSAFTGPDGAITPTARNAIVDQGWTQLTDETGVIGSNLVTDSEIGSSAQRRLNDAWWDEDLPEVQRILEEFREEAAQAHLRNPSWTSPDEIYDPVQDVMDIIPLDESISAMFHQINLDPIWVRLEQSDAPARELLENYLDSYGWTRVTQPDGSDIFVNPHYLEDAPLADLSRTPDDAILLSGEDAQEFIQNNVEARFVKREADDVARGGPPPPPPPPTGTAGRYFEDLPEGEINNMQMIDQLAKDSAMRGVKNLLYDISNTHGWAAGTRLMFPFGEAWQEIITRWAKLITENPRVVRRAQQVYQGGYSSGFIYDNEYGDPTFAYPGGELIGSGLMAAGRALQKYTGADQIGQGLEGVGTHLKEGNLRMTGSVKGLNLIGDKIPGMGPGIQLPVALFTPDTPLGDTVKNFVFPYGWPDINTPGGLLIDSVLPAWARKLGIGLTGIKPTSAQNGIFTSTVNDLMTLKLFRGEADPGDKDDQERLIQEARSEARTLWIISSILQTTFPTGPLREYRVKVNAPPIEQTELDNAVELGARFVTLRALANENARYMQAYDGDRLQATKAFIEMFGVDPLFDRAQTWTVRPMSVQREGRDFFLENEDLFGDQGFPLTAYYAYPDMPEGEYLQEAYQRQKDDRDRPQKTNDEYLRDINQALGERAYSELKRKADLAVIAGESTTTAVTEWLRAWRQILKTEYFGYGLPNYRAPEGYLPEDQLNEFRQWHTEPRLADTEAGQGIMEFMSLFDQAEAQGLAAGLTRDGWFTFHLPLPPTGNGYGNTVRDYPDSTPISITCGSGRSNRC